MSIGSGAHVGDWPRHEVVPPHVAAVGHVTSLLGAAQHEDVLDRRRRRDRLVGDVLERDDRAPAPGTVGGDEHLRLRVVDAVLERLRGEAAEHHRVRRADARTGEHGRDRLGDHAHVDRDPVALLHAERPQHVGDAARLLEQVAVGDRPRVAGLALPVERDLVAVARLDVAVEAVVRDVELAADEPLGEREIPLEDRVPLAATSRARAPGWPRSPASRARRRRRRWRRCRGASCETSAGGGKVRPSCKSASSASVMLGSPLLRVRRRLASRASRPGVSAPASRPGGAPRPAGSTRAAAS